MLSCAFFRRASSAALLLGVAACASLPDPLPTDGPVAETPVVRGPSVRRNHTPLEPAFGCLAQGIRNLGQPVFGVGVGDIKDYTGKYSTLEGNTITQGGALMIYSALGKLGDAVQLQERFDTRIAELELAYADRRQLGDGRTYQIEAGKPAVPWVPYFGGTIMRSSYYIVGGITELNHNIDSGGVEVTVSGIGGKRRTFTMNIGVDLRIVDTRSLVVVRTVSLQKQIIGKEVGAGIYRFFGNELLDVNVGSKSQEPLQLGVRTTIEHGVIELVAAVAGVDATPCLAGSPDASGVVAPALPKPAPARAPAAAGGGSGARVPAEQVAAPVAVASDAPAVGGVPQNSGAAAANGGQQIAFDVGSATLSGQAITLIEKIANDVTRGATVKLHLVVHDAESLAPIQRRDLALQRVKAVTDVLGVRGVRPSLVETVWLPSQTDAAITRQGPGFQLAATLSIRP